MTSDPSGTLPEEASPVKFEQALYFRKKRPYSRVIQISEEIGRTKGVQLRCASFFAYL
jgi:hypothetical protein